MKFLCDRCNTRYSIGDDRVRGKILKIRCKTCANVITVREGMPSLDAADSAESETVAERPGAMGPAPTPAGPTGPAGAQAARRLQKAPAGAPASQAEAPAPPRPAGAPAPAGALGAAFASAMTRPPPALQEEWYVSIEGEQAGPFSLGDAQRWVAAKPPEAELFCWSEGFDDWLPVDKVSHFRGLRKKPAPLAQLPGRPPTPLRSATAALGGPLPRAEPPPEDAPRPLFAATMAQVEKAAAPSPLRGPAAPAARLPAASPNGQAPAVNGAPAPPAGGGLPSALAARATATATAQPGARPGAGAKPLPRALGGGGMDDSATQIEPGLVLDVHTPVGARGLDDSATQLDPGLVMDVRTPVGARGMDDSATQIEPARALSDAGDAAATAPRLHAVQRAAAPALDPAPAPAEPGDGDGDGDDDDLDIGEVSRVVKLADLARDEERRRFSATPPVGVAAVRAAAAARLEAARPGEIAPSPFAIDAGTPGAPLLAAPDAAPPPVAVSHRRALIALIAGATVLVGIAVAVVFFVLTGEEDHGSRLTQVEEIDTTRPDELRPTGGSGGSASTAVPEPGPGSAAPKPRRPALSSSSSSPGIPEVGPQAAGKLEARDIEEMATRNSTVTQRCYMRAQRGAEGILTGDVKKVSVTLTIGGDGAVSDAQLADNLGQSSLGKCLIGAIRSWRFRSSPGGTFRFVLHFG